MKREPLELAQIERLPDLEREERLRDLELADVFNLRPTMWMLLRQASAENVDKRNGDINITWIEDAEGNHSI